MAPLLGVKPLFGLKVLGREPGLIKTGQESDEGEFILAKGMSISNGERGNAGRQS